MRIIKLAICVAFMCIISAVDTSAASPGAPEKDSYGRVIQPDSMFFWKQDSVHTFNRWFITVGGGVGRLLAEDAQKLPFWKEAKGMWTISAGAWITPVWGIRLQGSGGSLQGFALWTEGSGDDPGHGGGNWFLGEDYPNPIGRDKSNTYLEAAPDADPAIRSFIKNNYFDLNSPRTGKDGSKGYNYHFSYYTVMADMMLNLNNAIWGYSGREDLFQVMPFAGLGWAHTRKDGILPRVNSIAVRAGLAAGIRITDCIGLNIESSLMAVPEVFDRFVGGDRTQDAVFSLTGGLTYKFGKAKPKCSIKRYYKYHMPAPLPVAIPEPEPVVMVEPVCPGVQLSGLVYDTFDNPIENAVVFIYFTQKNEVKVLRTDYSGAYTTIVECGMKLAIKAVKNGYMDDCFRFAVADDDHTGKMIYQEVPPLRLARLEKNKIITLENIHYDFDKWDIRPDAAVELDKVIAFLHQNPAISVELGSHTDIRGSDAYNDRLSQKRAEAAVAYITMHGISSDRIIAKGYGKRKLLVKNPPGVPYTEEQHQANRRTEIRILDEGTSQLQSKDPWADYITGKIYQLNDLPSGFFDNCRVLR